MRIQRPGLVMRGSFSSLKPAPLSSLSATSVSFIFSAAAAIAGLREQHRRRRVVELHAQCKDQQDWQHKGKGKDDHCDVKRTKPPVRCPAKLYGLVCRGCPLGLIGLRSGCYVVACTDQILRRRQLGLLARAHIQIHQFATPNKKQSNTYKFRFPATKEAGQTRSNLVAPRPSPKFLASAAPDQSGQWQ